MALGSNTLGLLFKIGVDSKDVSKALDEIVGSNKQLRKEIEAGMEAESKAVLGLRNNFENLGRTAQQARAGIQQVFSGDVIEGAVTLTRAIGPVGLALAAVGAAAVAATLAVKAIVNAAEEIGTKSKDDFDELQKKVQSVGLTITDLQRDLGQGIMGALDQISGATTALFAKLIEKDGKALIALFNEVTAFIKDTLIPWADKFGVTLSDGIIKAIAAWRTLKQEMENPPIAPVTPGQSVLEALFPPLALRDVLKGKDAEANLYAENLKKVTEEVKKMTVAHATFNEEAKKTKKAHKDITDAALEQAKIENALTLVKQDAAIANKQINEDQAKGLITQKEGAKRRLEVLALVQEAEKKVLDARQKAVETDPTLLANQRAKQLAEIETQRAVLRTQAAEAEREENEKTIAADKKLHDAFAAHFAKLKEQWLDYAAFVKKTVDEVVKDIARQAQPVPGGGGVGPIPGLKEIPLPKPPTGVFQELGDVLKDSGAAFTTWSEFASKAIGAVAQATEQLLTTFILTGKGGGAAFKALAAQIIASLAVEAAVRALMELAYGIAELAKAAADPITAPQHILSAHLHFASAKTFGLIAAGAAIAGAAIGAAGGLGGAGAAGAAGGGGFGGEQAPGTVTINQGARAETLGISLLSSIDNHLSNITTAPPGDVLQRGADQNPMVVGQANNEAARRDGTVTRNFLEIAGLRPA